MRTITGKVLFINYYHIYKGKHHFCWFYLNSKY